MKYCKKYLIIFVFILISGISHVQGQYDAMFTQYMNNEMFINPAYAGSKEALGVTLLHRQQWVGINGRPITTTFSINGPLFDNKVGVGVSVLNERIGVTDRTMVYGSYAYRIRTDKKGQLAFGLMGGAHVQSNNLTKVGTTESGDSQFASDIKSAITPNFGFGIYYYTKKFYFGVSVPRMVDDNLALLNNGDIVKNLTVKPSKFHYYVVAGRIFRITPDFMLKPQLMMKAVANAPVEFDLNLSALIKETFWLGFSYRTGSDASAIIGIQATPQFLIGYSYDYSLTDLQKYNQGSHEIMLSYLFGYKGKKIVSPRYF